MFWPKKYFKIVTSNLNLLAWNCPTAATGEYGGSLVAIISMVPAGHHHKAPIHINSTCSPWIYV